MKHMKYIFLSILILLSFSSGCHSTHIIQKTSENGILNLSDWDFSRDGIVRLDGKWQFYWMQLLSPQEDFTKAELTGCFRFPGYWTGYPSLELPAMGYATYRLLIGLDGKKQILSLSTPDIYTEYTLWVNGTLIGSNMAAKNHEPSYLCPKIYELCADGSQLEIIIQVKNERHIYAGLGRSILLGSPEIIHSRQNFEYAIDFFLSVICFVAGLYHLLLHFLRKKNMETICFGILCLAVGIWTLLFNEALLMKAFPGIPFSFGSKLVTLTLPLCVISMTLYTRALYREDISRTAVKLILITNSIYALLVLICSPYHYLSMFIPYLLSIGMVCLYGAYISVRVLIRKRPEYQYYFAGIVLLAFGSIIDILNYLNLLHIGYLHSYCVALFIFFQTLLIGKRLLHILHNAEVLASDLEVSLGTIENTKTAFLNAQIKPHFLYNTLNTIAQCCQEDPEEAEALILYLSKYLRGSLSFENLGDAIPLRKELELVSAYFHIEKARFQNISLEYDIDEALLEYPIPPLIIQPLVENAVKHGIRSNENGGTVKVRIRNRASCISCVIEDNGVGMDAKLLNYILKQPTDSNSIGLYNIHNRLLRLFGKGLFIQSQTGTGTTITLELPYR